MQSIKEMTQEGDEKEKYLDSFFAITVDYWKGAFEHISDDLPDGAWWAMHEDGFEYQKKVWVKHAMKLCDLPPWPTDVDSNDMMHAYLRAIAED